MAAKTTMTDTNIGWMRTDLLASVTAMEFHATEAYCNLYLTNVQYSIRRLFREENKNDTARINHKNLLSEAIFNTHDGGNAVWSQ